MSMKKPPLTATSDGRRCERSRKDVINIPQIDSNSKTQIVIVLHHLLAYGSITPKEAEELYGIMRLGARIYELRKAGYAIITESETSVNRFGKKCSYARYVMKGHEE